MIDAIRTTLSAGAAFAFRHAGPLSLGLGVVIFAAGWLWAGEGEFRGDVIQNVD